MAVPAPSTSSAVTVPCWWGTREAGRVPGVGSLCRRSIFTPHGLSRCSSSLNPTCPSRGSWGLLSKQQCNIIPIYPWKCSLCAGLARIWEWKPQEHHFFHNAREILDAEGGPGPLQVPPVQGRAGTGTPQDRGQCPQHEDDQAGPSAPSVITESFPIQALQCLQGGFFFPSPHRGLDFRVWFLCSCFPALKSKLSLNKGMACTAHAGPRHSVGFKHLHFRSLKLQTVSSLWCFVSSEENLGLFALFQVLLAVVTTSDHFKPISLLALFEMHLNTLFSGSCWQKPSSLPALFVSSLSPQ